LLQKENKKSVWDRLVPRSMQGPGGRRSRELQSLWEGGENLLGRGGDLNLAKACVLRCFGGKKGGKGSPQGPRGERGGESEDQRENCVG